MSDQTSTRPRRWHVVAAASVGNALEWYDFIVYGFFAVTMAKLFFPAGDPTVSLLVAFATFGVTFLVRPVGAVIIGSYADRHGRKAAFTLTIVMMTIGTAIIAFAPTYAAIGVGAPLLILVARIIQGFSAGGEFGSATALLAEQNPKRRGFFASWQFASQGITLVLATGVGVILLSTLSKSQMESWGWRLPYIFGLVIGPVAYYVRRHVHETVEFQSTEVSRSPLREALTDAKLRLLISFGAIILGTVGLYTILFMSSYATRQLGIPGSGAFFAGFLTGVIQVVFIPLVGALSDRVGRVPIGTASAAAMLVAHLSAVRLADHIADAPDAADRAGHHGLVAGRVLGRARRVDGRTVSDPHAHDGAVDQLLVWRGFVRRICAVHQCLAHQRHRQ